MGFTSCKGFKADSPSMEMIVVIKEIFRIVGLVGTYEILKRMKERERCSYVDLPDIISTATLNTRLIQLKSLRLITLLS